MDERLKVFRDGIFKMYKNAASESQKEMADTVVLNEEVND